MMKNYKGIKIEIKPTIEQIEKIKIYGKMIV